MFLQTASRLHAGDTVTPESLVEIAGIVPQRLIKTLLDAVMNKRFDPIQVAVKELILEGFGAGQVLSQVCFLLGGLTGIGSLFFIRIHAKYLSTNRHWPSSTI